MTAPNSQRTGSGSMRPRYPTDGVRGGRRGGGGGTRVTEREREKLNSITEEKKKCSCG